MEKGNKVFLTEHGKKKTGKVEEIFFDSLVIVRLEDGTLVKRFIENVYEDKIEEEKEDPEDKKILISEKEFRDILINLAANMSDESSGKFGGMVVTLVGALICKKLFREKND